MFHILVPGKNVRLKFYRITVPISIVVIYAMIIPLVFVDITCIVYQQIYFSLNGIPKVPRRNFVLFDRGRLKKLNIWQRFNCLYCDYANGLVAWLVEVLGTTELYSCAIKHPRKNHVKDDQSRFHEYEDFT
mgnify:CR=1 FL=1